MGNSTNLITQEVVYKFLMKKRSERCKHCTLAVVRRSQKICPAADPLRCKESTLAIARHRQNRSTTDPFPGARDGQNLISWRWSLPIPTNPVW